MRRRKAGNRRNGVGIPETEQRRSRRLGAAVCAGLLLVLAGTVPAAGRGKAETGVRVLVGAGSAETAASGGRSPNTAAGYGGPRSFSFGSGTESRPVPSSAEAVSSFAEPVSSFAEPVRSAASSAPSAVPVSPASSAEAVPPAVPAASPAESAVSSAEPAVSSAGTVPPAVPTASPAESAVSSAEPAVSSAGTVPPAVPTRFPRRLRPLLRLRRYRRFPPPRRKRRTTRRQSRSALPATSTSRKGGRRQRRWTRSRTAYWTASRRTASTRCAGSICSC